MQRAQICISEKEDQCAFTEDETVTDLTAVSHGVTASQSCPSGAICERTLWFIIPSFYNDFL